MCAVKWGTEASAASIQINERKGHEQDQWVQMYKKGCRNKAQTTGMKVAQQLWLPDPQPPRLPRSCRGAHPELSRHTAAPEPAAHCTSCSQTLGHRPATMTPFTQTFNNTHRGCETVKDYTPKSSKNGHVHNWCSNITFPNVLSDLNVFEDMLRQP